MCVFKLKDSMHKSINSGFPLIKELLKVVHLFKNKHFLFVLIFDWLFFFRLNQGLISISYESGFTRYISNGNAK